MSDLKGVIDAALAHELVREEIEDQTGNMLQRHVQKRDLRRAVSGELTAFAREAAEMILKDEVPPPNFSDPDWKQDFANQVGKSAVKDQAFEALIRQTIARVRRRLPMGVRDQADRRWSYFKITDCVGQVSRMIRLGLPPELLVLSEEESRKELLKLRDMARKAGVPTAVVVPKEDGGGRGRPKGGRGRPKN